MRRIIAGGMIVAVAAILLIQQISDEAEAQDGYLVLALSWTPSWCEIEGAARDDARCAPDAGIGWKVHGLWPQYTQGGWPEFCDTPHPNPTRAQTAAMVDIMGSSGLANHQWRKHGSCTGQSADAYFLQTRAAFAGLNLPEDINAQTRQIRLAPSDILSSFRDANPDVGADMVTLTCRAGLAQEIRVCLTHELRPRACDADLLSRSCRASSVLLPVLP